MTNILPVSISKKCAPVCMASNNLLIEKLGSPFSFEEKGDFFYYIPSGKYAVEKGK